MKLFIAKIIMVFSISSFAHEIKEVTKNTTTVEKSTHTHEKSCKKCDRHSCDLERKQTIIQNCNSNNVKKEVIIKWKPRKTKYIYRDREVVKWKYKKTPSKTRVVKKVKKVYVKRKQRKHSVSLLGLASKTKLETRSVNGGGASEFEAETKYEPDMGLMYQYDFDRVRGTVGGTLNGSAFIGVGFNF